MEEEGIWGLSSSQFCYETKTVPKNKNNLFKGKGGRDEKEREKPRNKHFTIENKQMTDYQSGGGWRSGRTR